MGFSRRSINQFIRLGKAGKLKPGGKVLEFGSQNIYGEHITTVDAWEFCKLFTGKATPHEEIKRLIEWGEKDEPLLRAAGFDYTAFDVYAQGRTRIFDLNTQSLDAADVGAYDLVTNYGTSEHVMNQYNVFKVAHDALKVGGVMINSVPFYGLINHGLINYHPKFFTALIKANAYECLSFGFTDIYSCDHADYYGDAQDAENGEKWQGKTLGSAEMYVIYQKVAGAPFRAPVDTGEYVHIRQVFKKH